jgi:hypothetical protein
VWRQFVRAIEAVIYAIALRASNALAVLAFERTSGAKERAVCLIGPVIALDGLVALG